MPAPKFSRERNKNTDSGPLHINDYIAMSTSAQQSVDQTTPDTIVPADFGATNARFALVQVITADSDLVVEIGISDGVNNALTPGTGSMRVGRTYGMPYLQIPGISTAEMKVLADPAGSSSTVNYTVTFVD